MFDFEYFIICVSMLYTLYAFLHLEIFDKCINRNWLTIPRSINIYCRTHRPTLNSSSRRLEWKGRWKETQRQWRKREIAGLAPRGKFTTENYPRETVNKSFFLATRTVHVRYKKRSSLREAGKETLEGAIRLRRSIKGTPGMFDVQQIILYFPPLFFVVYRLK